VACEGGGFRGVQSKAPFLPQVTAAAPEERLQEAKIQERVPIAGPHVELRGQVTKSMGGKRRCDPCHGDKMRLDGLYLYLPRDATRE
jgi:hypothetical protein